MPRNLSAKQKTGTFTDKIFGDPSHHSLENRILNVILMMIIFTSACATLLNLFTGNPLREVIITVTATIIPTCFYIASRWFHADKYLSIPLTVIFLIILSVAWFTNQGSSGSTMPYFFILVVAVNICVPSPYAKLMLGISFVTVVALLLVEHFIPSLIIPYLTASHMILDKIMCTIICLVVITILIHLILKEYQKEKIRREELYEQTLKDKEELIEVLSENKMLKGILPLCSFCKRIRDENNEWQTMEDYIGKHSEAMFSHGFCPDCGKKHYPEHFLMIDKSSR